MQLLKYPGWLLGCCLGTRGGCYAVVRVPGWLLGCCYAVARVTRVVAGTRGGC